MIKSVPFTFFNPNDTMYFDTVRLIELEERLGMPMGDIILMKFGMKFCLFSCIIGLKHLYKPNNPVVFFSKKIDEAIENGATLNDIGMQIALALNKTGIFDHGNNTVEEGEGEEKNVN